MRIIYLLININRYISFKTKKVLTLYKKDFFIPKICKFFDKLVAIFISLLFLIDFNIKYQISLKIDALGYAISKILPQK